MDSKTLEQIFKIHGFLQRLEALALYKYASKVKVSGVIVELGSWQGRSTVCLALGAKKGLKQKIYAIDTFEGDFETGKKKTFSLFKKNLQKFKVQEFVVPLKKNTHQAGKLWTKPIALLWIDASHIYEDVLKDFLLWEPFVVDQGLILMHDSLNNNGPRKLLETTVLKGNKWKIVGFVESITILRKVKKLTFYQKIYNYFVFYLRDIKYSIYINIWPIRQLLGRINLYEEKQL